ncbi:polysaccharide pyruvyl transferase family protein [Arthrobacter rhombi]|uniref:polysaccharide pyruvyl transferase family protein n=1 Tax=Arthrobacter rhombi TaxID=71253 RepID=UPI003FD544AD
MSRILIRSAKQPWLPVSAEGVLTGNVLATNIGNLLFGQSVHRMLSTPGTEITPNNYMTGRAGIDDRLINQINDEYDHFVVPLANAFRPSFKGNLQRLTRVISGLDIPVTVVGVGSQHNLDESPDTDDPIAEEVKEFMAAVLNRSSSVGVRGEMTADYLAGLGFGEEHVDVIGCPSLYLRGRNPQVSAKTTSIDQDSRIAMSVSPYVEQMHTVVERHTQKYPNLIYIPQNDTDLTTMLWGQNPSQIPDLRQPIHIDHPLFTEDRMRFPLDPRTWYDYLEEFDFAFGTRIHGTIASILAGTPAVLLTHDSRTQELADYHAIPNKPITQITPATDAKDLFADCDYTEFNARLPETFDRFTKFLEKNDLEHIYQAGKESTEFDEKLAAADLPPMVHTILAPGEAGRRETMSRLRWLRQGKAEDMKRTRFAFEHDLPHTPKKPKPTPADKRIKALELELKALREDLKMAQTLDPEVKIIKKELKKAQTIIKQQAKDIKRLDVSLFTRGKRFLRRMGRKAVPSNKSGA